MEVATRSHLSPHRLCFLAQCLTQQILIQFCIKKKIKITTPIKGIIRLAKIWRYRYLKEHVSQAGFDCVYQKRQIKFVSMIFRSGSHRTRSLEVAGSRSFNSAAQQHHRKPRPSACFCVFSSARQPLPSQDGYAIRGTVSSHNHV